MSEREALWEVRAQIAVKRWVLAKHNEFEKRVTQRIMDLDQIERAWFDHIPGYSYSEYTEESPEAAIEYAYIDNVGKKQIERIAIEGNDVAAFLVEVLPLMESE